MEELIKEMNLKQINIEGDFIINKHQLKEFAEKYQALQLQQTGVIKSLPNYELEFCERCFQMTNHLNNKCQKCKGNVL